jgi:hypothetical protein
MAVIRFRELVNTSGKPEAKSLWTDPKQDRQFMQAVKQSRVLTVVQEPTSKRKDFGEVGFHQQPHASYFVFPRPLPASRGSKVIGIKYDLVGETEVKDPIRRKALVASKRKPAKPERIEKTFHVRVRRIAVAEATIPVEARSQTEAREKAVEIAKKQTFDVSKAELRTETLSVD